MSPYEIHFKLFLRERSIATMTDYLLTEMKHNSFRCLFSRVLQSVFPEQLTR